MQSSGLNSLFVQLQTRFPGSSMVTELVQIYEGGFVVRALVQAGSTTFATGMAAASSVEAAEDQARLRVLHFLGIVSGVLQEPGAAQQPMSARDPVETPDLSMPLSPLATHQPWAVPSPLLSIPKEDSFLSGINQPAIASPDSGEALEAQAAMETASILPAPPVSKSRSSGKATLQTESISSQGLSQPLVDLEEQRFSSEEPYESSFDLEPPMLEESDDESDRPDDSPMDDPYPELFNLTDPVMESPSAIAPPAQNKPASRNSTQDNPVEMSAVDDLSSLIAMTDVEMDRIGWSKQQGRDHLKRTYKKSTRQRLDVEEMMDFLNYLRALPSLNGL